ncbi:DUF6573 family protein [Phycisphaerales bacterium AB-hyl4]|uniref:DUF6573 family protein n=1 Tax=Natronomicrosphaera hydrolytica TaxID=3242702 RepID=A0ABV4U636_9BACT
MAETHPESDPIIYRYTRQQALADGVLVDLTEWAKETGFHCPVACTAAVWHGYVVPREGLRSLGQSERGRGHDLLWMLYHAIRRSRRKDQLLFQVIFLMEPERQETVTLKVICGPGDEGEPVLTILLPNED